MIPTNRPVIGQDLEVVTQQFGILVSDACWLFGLSITKWTQIVRGAPQEPIANPTLALLVRFLAEHPELNVIPTFPNAADMFQEINAIQEIDQKRFSVLFGSEASATYRWLKPGSRISPVVGRLMLYMRMALRARQPNDRSAMLGRWCETVRNEGRARGVDDIFGYGAWNPKAKRPPRKTSTGEQVTIAKNRRKGTKAKAVQAEST